MIFPAQVAESDGQGERDEDQKDFSRAGVPWFFLVFEQVVEISGSGGVVGIDTERSALGGSRCVQAKEGRSTNRGRLVGACGGGRGRGFGDSRGCDWR